jgi:phage-related protein
MVVKDDPIPRPLLWVGSSHGDMEDMPRDVRSDFGHGLYEAQLGRQPAIAKIFKHLGESGVWELVTDDRAGTFRAVYTVKFSDAIVVLHVFQKKSKSGISTPKAEVDLIRQRLKAAVDVYKGWKEGKKR